MSVLPLLRELIAVRTENPPGGEKALAERLRGILRQHSIPASVDVVAPGRANLVARIAGSHPGPVLALNGHLDTVPVKEGWTVDPFAGIVTGGRLIGLGAADMKGAVAAMVIAAAEARREVQRMRGTLVLAFVADEERTNLGTLDYLRRYPKPDYVVIGEPSGLDLVTSNRGTLRLLIKTHGVAGHSSNPRSGVNAIYAMAEAVARLKEYAAGLSGGKGHYTTKPSLSVTLVNGGTGENIIPDLCQITIDRRLVFGENRQDVEAEILKVIGRRPGARGSSRYSYERVDFMEPWRAQVKSPLAASCIRTYRKCFKASLTRKDLGGTSEAGLFAKKGIDTVIIGPGNIAQAHTKDEFIEIEQLEKAVEFYRGLIREILFKGEPACSSKP